MTGHGADGLPDWRDTGAYRRLAAIDRAGLMWEWLRRDPGYLSWYLDASRATTGAVPDASAWGAHFRRESCPRRPVGADRVACLA